MIVFFVALVVAFSGFINSLTGFGFIIVAAPFLVQLLPPREAASVALVLGIILAAVVAIRERKTIAVKVTIRMFLAAILGIPVGTALLVGVDPAVIKIIVGTIVLGVTVALVRGLRLPPSFEFHLSLAAGFLSGILSGVSGMSGAMAVIYFMGQGWAPARVRPTIASFNVVVSMVTLVWLLSTGTIGPSQCTFALMFLPPAILGIACSGFLYKRIEARHYRPLTFLLVTIAGLLAIIAGIRELIS